MNKCNVTAKSYLSKKDKVVLFCHFLQDRLMGIPSSFESILRSSKINFLFIIGINNGFV